MCYHLTAHFSERNFFFVSDVGRDGLAVTANYIVFFGTKYFFGSFLTVRGDGFSTICNSFRQTGQSCEGSVSGEDTFRYFKLLFFLTGVSSLYSFFFSCPDKQRLHAELLSSAQTESV